MQFPCRKLGKAAAGTNFRTKMTIAFDKMDYFWKFLKFWACTDLGHHIDIKFTQFNLLWKTIWPSLHMLLMGRVENLDPNKTRSDFSFPSSHFFCILCLLCYFVVFCLSYIMSDFNARPGLKFTAIFLHNMCLADLGSTFVRRKNLWG